MEGGGTRTRRRAATASPGRNKVWVEPPGKTHHLRSPPPPPSPSSSKRVAVVYYLCRNRHLEHPHFIEVPLASPDGLYLRDVINRLNVLRGKGMAAMYSWSCKRSYKNGFVWHDLSEDDLVLPAQGNEYILKGSELLDRSPPDRQQNGVGEPKVETLKHPPEESPHSRGSQEGCSSSSSPSAVTKEASPPPPTPQPQQQAQSATLLPSSSASTNREDDQCRTPRSGSSGNMSPEPAGRVAPPLSEASSPGPLEYRVCKPIGAQDASTQTDDSERDAPERNSRMAGVCTENSTSDSEIQECHPRSTQPSPKGPGVVRESPPVCSSDASPGGRVETLESLIRAEASRRSSFRALEEEHLFAPMGVKFKPANLLMQLITCGSISVKDHRSFGLIPTYRPRGSLVETKKQDESGKGGTPTLKRSSSCSEDRVSDSNRDMESMAESGSFRCLPQTIKMISCKQSRSGTILSPNSDVRNSYSRQECSTRSSPLGSSKSASNRMTDLSLGKLSSSRVESFHEEKEKVIKIEES
uniref:SOSEKI DIX-like domain-containing protein n=1 Tax=Oryza glumipatula TaxID=40148 RepID=A0A0E0AYZ1_9ORYZ